MPLIIALGTFFAVGFTVYGLFYQSSVVDPMEARLGGLRYTRPKREALPETEGSFKVRVLAPLVQSMSQRVNRILPSTITERLQGALTQGGLKLAPGHFIIIVGLMMG